jgi:hypothetical protein
LVNFPRFGKLKKKNLATLAMDSSSVISDRQHFVIVSSFDLLLSSAAHPIQSSLRGCQFAAFLLF